MNTRPTDEHQTSVCTPALDIGSNMMRPKLFFHSPWSPRWGNDPPGREHVTVGVQRVSRQNLVAACVPSSSVQNRRFDVTFYFYYLLTISNDIGIYTSVC